MKSRSAALVAALLFSLGCAPSLTPPAASRPVRAPAPIAAASPTPAAVAVIPTPLPGGLPGPIGTRPTGCESREAPPAPAPGAPLHTLRIFDIGQGDSELLRTASGKTVLIDAGDRDHSSDLLADLAAAGVTRIDLLVATHPHLDHIGGMAAVLEKYPVRLYVDPGTDHPTDTYKALLELLQTKKVAYNVLRAGKTLNLGSEATLKVVSPPADHLIATQRSPENANSLVIKLTIGTFTALFTGDAEPETLDAVAAEVGTVDFLKVAHHGSRYGTSAEFLDALKPRVASISFGAHNDYHHPHKETVALLAERCITTYRTDRDGVITLVTDGRGWRVTTSKGTTFEAAVPGPGGDDARLPSGGRDRVATPSPGGVTNAADTAGAVYASRRSKVYHPAGCSHLANIKEENRVEYSSAADAEAAGLHSAANCHVSADGANPPAKEREPAPDADDSGGSKKSKPKTHRTRKSKS